MRYLLKIWMSFNAKRQKKNSTPTVNRCAKSFHSIDEATTYQVYHLWGWKSRKTGGFIPRLDLISILS